VERSSGGTFHIVDSVTINTRGNVRIALPDQGFTMNALFVDVMDLRMALFTGLRDFAAGFIRGADVVGSMTISTYRRLQIPCS
jgi:hypothetical protein